MSTAAGNTFGERQPLLKPGDKQHYNLVGLSAASFWILCLSMWGCALLAAFDGTVVATLVGPISSSFHASNEAAWLGTAYLLSVCCFTPIYGRLSDAIGRQKTMMVSLVIFGLGNAFCAVAPTMRLLIAARAFAGIGGGGLQTVTSTIASDIVPLSHRGMFQGYSNIMFGAGAALGPPIGGLINDSFGWRWTFAIQLPFFVLALFFTYLYICYPMPEKPDSPKTTMEALRRLDIMGCLLLGSWIGCLLFAISLVTTSTSNEYTWSSWQVITLLAVSAALLVTLVTWEVWVVRYPVISVELLHRRTPVAVAINNWAFAFSFFALMYSIPLFLGTVRLMTASEAGRHLTPVMFVGISGSLGAGLVIRATGKGYWITILGGIIMVASSVLICTWTQHTPDIRLWTDFPFTTIGSGMVSTGTIVALVGDVGRDGAAAATGLSYTARMSGQVLGVGITGAIMQAVLGRELSSRISGPGSQEIIDGIRLSSDSVRHLAEPYQTAAVASYETALRTVFFCASGILVLALIASFWVKELDMKQDPAQKPADEENNASAETN